jgi:hypothetical protein
MKIEEIPADAALGKRPRADDETAWFERDTGSTLRVESRTGGPGWVGANLTLKFREQAIRISPSWGNQWGIYEVGISTIELPKGLLSEKKLIEDLVVEGVAIFCRADNARDFSPLPFKCTVDLSRTIWIEV